MSDRELEPLAGDLQELLEAERRAPPAPSEARERVRARLRVSLGLAAGLGAAAAATKAAAATGTSAVLAGKTVALKLALLLLGAGAIGAGAYVALRAPAGRVISSAQRERAALLEPNQTLHSRPTVTIPSLPPEPAAPRPARAHGAGSDEPAGALAAEEALLEEARATLHRGDYRRALAALAQHDRRFHDGQLAEERESLWVKALVAADELGAARDRGDAFRARYPRSLFRPVVEATLRALP